MGIFLIHFMTIFIFSFIYMAVHYFLYNHFLHVAIITKTHFAQLKEILRKFFKETS